MNISENKVYVFKFAYENSDITLPVPADSKEEAVQKLQKWMSRVQTEMAMEFPRTVPADVAKVQAQPLAMHGAVPDEVLEMRIDTLLGDLGVQGAALMTREAKAAQVKHWVQLDFVSQNYGEIIKKLEVMLVNLNSEETETPIAPKKKK